uniref:Uncharacterized protein n=1 Tax=Chromera velia CCMP2878 TaxID=1169474 RepID=A0A0G4G9K4_9ALVE|eukprot:Cvel_20816.t1-p1 / transcript=Cvel_20816.t1 / gene=Cvel_20816 / organism=Chromera_velia_CCMP2878 / gene_product=Ankyrin-1, putative / transcript_product=Ankyrin-1, putative / location=Cvel_scaffold1903:10613-11659(-) / protein_length=349 / sequence_SO=supercontig / SO=protein_coding / is_pseudo=false
MDLSGLFVGNFLRPGAIRQKLRSFQPVEPQKLFDALGEFVKTGKRGDLILLLRVGADVDGFVKQKLLEGSQNRTALMQAVVSGSLEAVKMLVSVGARLERRTKFGLSALHLGCMEGRVKIVEYLVKKGAEMEALTREGRTPLWLSALMGHEKVVEFLASKGANVRTAEWSGDSALHAAAVRGHREAVKVLLDRGANIDAEGKFQLTPLALTTLYPNDHLDVAKLLVRRGANVNHRAVQGGTVLHAAALNGSADVLEYVLTRDVDLHARDDFGRTALHYATRHCLGGGEDDLELNKIRIAQRLLTRGIDVNALDVYGETARDLSRKRPEDSLVRMWFANLHKVGAILVPS